MKQGDYSLGFIFVFLKMVKANNLKLTFNIFR